MHIFVSGIGGTGVGPLALVAKQAGFEVSGSDKQDSLYITYLKEHGITAVHIGQSAEQLAAVHAARPIDWFIYSSSVAIEQPDSPELRFCQEQNIRTSKRDDFLNFFLQEKKLPLIAVAGTHGKTTTTAMAVWLLQQLGTPESHILPAKSGFTDMGHYQADAQYFVYECDEFDRNFLSFTPQLSLITGIDWDHPDIYPTRESYYAAFHDFLEQSDHSFIWGDDAARLGIATAPNLTILSEDEPAISQSKLVGLVNRHNAWLVANAVHRLTQRPVHELYSLLDGFPGVSRRFEAIIPNLYSDYAHTVPKIQGALQLAREVADDRVVVVYEGLHNTRQHFIKNELSHLFDGVKKLYIVPSYLAREDPALTLLSPADLKLLLSDEAQTVTEPAELNEDLRNNIQKHLEAGDTVLALTAGGGGSLDEWLRQTFAPNR